MFEALLSNPIWIIGLGSLIIVLSVICWTQIADPIGQKISFRIAIFAFLLTAILTAVSFQIETDHERITNTLRTAATAIEENDVARVLTYVHPGAADLKQRAEAVFESFHFEDARVTRIKEITINQDTTPPTAIVEFNVVVELERFGRVPRFVKAYFAKKDDKWLIQDYEHFDATEGFKAKSP